MRFMALGFLLVFIPIIICAQTNSIKGIVQDEKGLPLAYGTVALLNPADSTLSAFAITNNDGFFECKTNKTGKYIMQVAYVGYSSYMKEIILPLTSNSDQGIISLKPKVVDLNEVNVVGEQVPILIKRDTVEYNALSFKTGTNAVVEDLLKKLPGVEVDRAGNIKAMGEIVNKVKVDGKEFFSNDPKIATKNLPANVIKKVQVYDNRSDESKFTGISDGTYEKEINLLLKDDKKNGTFGELLTGGDLKDHYQLNAKLFRFNPKNQYAGIGMANNVNQYGFSLTDYLRFNKGSMDDYNNGYEDFRKNAENLPINFGQSITGAIAPWAAGVNYSRQKEKESRFNINYLSNGTSKRLDESIDKNSYTAGENFEQHEETDQKTRDNSHSLNVYWKNKIDSCQLVIVNSTLVLSNGSQNTNSFIQSYRQDLQVNDFNSHVENMSNRVSLNGIMSYINKLNRDKTQLKLKGKVSYSGSLSEFEWNNLSHFFTPERLINDQCFQNNNTRVVNFDAETSLIHNFGNKWSMEPGVYINYRDETLDREVGTIRQLNNLVDSLSPDFSVRSYIIRPDFIMRKNIGNHLFTATARFEFNGIKSKLNVHPELVGNNFFFLPKFQWQNNYQSGRRMIFNYSTSVNLPSVLQLLPVPNTSNSLMVYSGNQSLKPEFSQIVAFKWSIWDIFSFTNFLTSVQYRYTEDKISRSYKITPGLAQEITPINVASDQRAIGSISFSTPIKPVGLIIKFDVNELWTRGITVINQVQNTNTNFTNQISLGFDNRHKNNWDVSVGGSYEFTDASYSLKPSLNQHFYNYSAYAEVNYYPKSDRWNIRAKADVTKFDAQSFEKSITIPLIEAGFNYNTKNKLWVISVSGFDLLKRDIGLRRMSDANYLQEIQSNTLGRYFMVSIKYRFSIFPSSKK